MPRKKLIREPREYSLEDTLLVMEIVCRYVNKEREFNHFYATERRASGLFGLMIEELDHALTTGKPLEKQRSEDY